MSNQAFNQDHQEVCAHQTNVEEAQNGASRTLAKPVNNKDANENQWQVAPSELQMKTSENKSGTTTKTTKRKQKVNKIPQSVKANANGGERNN